MTYEVLERATNYFNPSNKLGQGGSGSVYKVTIGLAMISFSVSAKSFTQIDRLNFFL